MHLLTRFCLSIATQHEIFNQQTNESLESRVLRNQTLHFSEFCLKLFICLHKFKVFVATLYERKVQFLLSTGYVCHALDNFYLPTSLVCSISCRMF